MRRYAQGRQSIEPEHSQEWLCYTDCWNLGKCPLADDGRRRGWTANPGRGGTRTALGDRQLAGGAEALKGRSCIIKSLFLCAPRRFSISQKPLPYGHGSAWVG